MTMSQLSQVICYCRLLCVEHIEEYNKPVLYIAQVFEYCTTDLKNFMDRTGKGPSNPLPKELIKVASFQ